MAEKASGTPTKEFFVGMLTRDIELNDAILDLLDNCLDGVVRQKRGIDRNSTPDYYKGFYSHITISQESFIIEDNCGGIPRDVAEKYAFRMGRSSEKNDDDLPTVGIYGIKHTLRRNISPFRIFQKSLCAVCKQQFQRYMSVQ